MKVVYDQSKKRPLSVMRIKRVLFLLELPYCVPSQTLTSYSLKILTVPEHFSPFLSDLKRYLP